MTHLSTLPRNVKPRAKRTCAVPGCEAVLGKYNSTGLCARHPHSRGLCSCLQCKPNVQPPPPQPQPHTKRGITLPQAPWDGI